MIELVLGLPQALVEPVSDVLTDELEALSVSVEDAEAGTDAESALFGEPDMPVLQAGWRHSTLRALFDTERRAEAAAALLLSQDWTQGLKVLGLVAVPDQDWVQLTQSQFDPVQITPDFWIVPSWHTPPDAAQRIIRLDPGLAFGTGTHPTTRMCLRWLAANAQPWNRVLDYGCGSGILAIAAALMGARAVDAVDIDPAAVHACHHNAQANGVSLSAGEPTLASGRYALVLANILAQPLKLLAPLLCGHMEESGHLLLAGLLERQVEELQRAYAPWLALEVLDMHEGWVLLGARRVSPDRR